MEALRFKPNLAGVLLLLSTLLLVAFAMPMRLRAYSENGAEWHYSIPWLQLSLCALFIIFAYPYCMALGFKLAKQGAARIATGPLMIIPQALLVASGVGMFLYTPPEMHGQLERHLFLQGNTDLGGGCLFAGTIALYVVFGFTAAWYLTLSLEKMDRSAPGWRIFLYAFWLLGFHMIVFVLGGIANFAYDSRVTPNDFRNLFLFAALIYTLSILFIVALHRTRLSLRTRLALAPLFTLIWLVIGSDGNTARAGQLVQAGQDPQPIVRSFRHHIMLSWHHLCDRALGDIPR